MRIDQKRFLLTIREILSVVLKMTILHLLTLLHISSVGVSMSRVLQGISKMWPSDGLDQNIRWREWWKAGLILPNPFQSLGNGRLISWGLVPLLLPLPQQSPGPLNSLCSKIYKDREEEDSLNLFRAELGRILTPFFPLESHPYFRPNSFKIAFQGVP